MYGGKFHFQNRFCFVLICIREQIPCTSPWGAYIRRGNLTKGFLRYDFEGLIFGGAYTWRGLFSEIYGNFYIFFCISWAPSAVEVKREGSPTKDTNKYIHHKIATTRLQAFACFFVSCCQKKKHYNTVDLTPNPHRTVWVKIYYPLSYHKVSPWWQSIKIGLT